MFSGWGFADECVCLVGGASLKVVCLVGVASLMSVC